METYWKAVHSLSKVKIEIDFQILLALITSPYTGVFQKISFILQDAC